MFFSFTIGCGHAPEPAKTTEEKPLVTPAEKPVSSPSTPPPVDMPITKSDEKSSPPANAARSPREALRAGVAYLFAKQAADGGWHSEEIGALKGGAAITAAVLYALSHVPEAERPADFAARVERGLAFLLPGIKRHGYVVNPDDSPDYPPYATAMVVLAAERLGAKLPDDVPGKMTDFLLRAQRNEAGGFPPDQPHHGGWDNMGEVNAPGITTGTNVSVSAYALEALAARRAKETTRAKAIDETFSRAQRWAARCQNVATDGGFYFHPEPSADGNKALWRDEARQQARSYGSATADGVRCLRACGVAGTDARVTAAMKWLADRPNVEQVPGFEDLPPEIDWAPGLRFYYYASLAQVLDLLPADQAAARRTTLANHLARLQQPDGRFQNTSDRMREHDPLIATPLALVALSRTAP